MIRLCNVGKNVLLSAWVRVCSSIPRCLPSQTLLRWHFFPQKLDLEGLKGCMASEARSQHAEHWAAEVLAGSSTELCVVPVLAVHRLSLLLLISWFIDASQQNPSNFLFNTALTNVCILRDRNRDGQQFCILSSALLWL